MTNEKSSIKRTLGCLPKAVFWNFALGALMLSAGKLLGGPEIYISRGWAIGIFLVLLAGYFTITFWSIWTLAKSSDQTLISHGPYAFVRHPMYSAIIFILNPALAILFRSWLLFFAAIGAYFIWRRYVEQEEKMTEERFGREYFLYRVKTPAFLPKLWIINKFAFYTLSALAIFVVVFGVLNFPAVYLRWVTYEKTGEIIYDEPGRPSQLPGQSDAPKSNYTDRSNSVLISKLGVDAPLIFPAGTSQKELNAALNEGIIVYPGSALPGQNGEVFLSGHSSTFIWNKTSYGQVFALLDKLEAGDVVSIAYNNLQYDYRVTGKEVLTPSQTILTKTEQPTITLMTCWPIGTSLKRLVVRGELVR